MSCMEGRSSTSSGLQISGTFNMKVPKDVEYVMTVKDLQTGVFSEVENFLKFSVDTPPSRRTSGSMHPPVQPSCQTRVLKYKSDTLYCSRTEIFYH